MSFKVKCITKDGNYLLVGSKALLSVSEADTREVTKEFKLTGYVRDIKFIKDGKKAIIAE